ncbi:hypothetical protein P872_24825 [Rhodonellum psychrophilum GCM71 = DSM 17998]|uniref:Uncharacterized protein n=1 Tax=Rhodonellum psychrophilum GCM71 = DSM 17998 TaxID=1123057 RepID=U5C494_9BACT|nr:hypothetical protein P872_24825 [Rhodonellum psychrophilum GCM71 = DSM 17998]
MIFIQSQTVGHNGFLAKTKQNLLMKSEDFSS